jgi:hypothetical protein
MNYIIVIMTTASRRFQYEANLYRDIRNAIILQQRIALAASDGARNRHVEELTISDDDESSDDCDSGSDGNSGADDTTIIDSDTGTSSDSFSDTDDDTS